MWSIPVLFLILAASPPIQCQRRVNNRLTEVFAWKQITYDIDGVLLTEDRDTPVGLSNRSKRQYIIEDDDSWEVVDPNASSTTRPTVRPTTKPTTKPTTRPTTKPTTRPTTKPTTKPTSRPTGDDDANRFYIKYNNVPMGAEKVGNRLFITVPRRRYGIPSTLNYIDLDTTNQRSPALKPYPDIRQAQSVTSVYRTRADSCGRLWMVDTGRLELPGTQKQVRTPGIVIYDLKTNRLIRRYDLKPSDLPQEDTPTGLASITVDITNNDCANAYAYIPDLTSFGLIVYSFGENDSWRHTHNYFSFHPLHGALDIAGQKFSWRDGIFSITLLPGVGDCKRAYFHSLIGTDEFEVSTCLLKNRTAINARDYYAQYNVVGNRGEGTQSTMHDYHPGTKVVFFAEVGRDAVSCWNTNDILTSTNIAIVARDRRVLSYPSDLHVTGEEIWVMTNTLPRFGYSTLDTNSYNFFVYKASIIEAVSGTICTGSLFDRAGFNSTTGNEVVDE